MLKAQRVAYVAFAVIMDIVVLIAAFYVAWQLRDSLGSVLLWVGDILALPVKEQVRRVVRLPNFYNILLSTNPLVDINYHLWILYLSLPSWLFFLQVQRGYDPMAQRGARQELAIVAYAGLLCMGVLLVFMFLAKFEGVSRLLVINFLLLGTILLWLQRAVILPLLARRRRQPARNLLIIGNQRAAAQFSLVLATPAYRWSRLLGFVSDELPHDNADACPYLGDLDGLEQLLDREVVDEVVIIRSSSDLSTALAANEENDARTPVNARWGRILELCLERGRTVSLVDDIAPPVNAKMQATMLGSLPTLVLHNTPQNTLELVIKSALDRVIALIALIMLAPLFIAIAAIIKLTAPGPIFFTQERVGLNGRRFKFFKFRSMAVNAQEILERMKREEPERYRAINIMEEPFFKARDGEEPRITTVGRFIRKYSLDELPQFWNVLKGDMSLVGPRPPLPKEVEELKPWQRRKLSVKGGLTCIWQASGRNDIKETDEWMRLDLEYIDNWSLWLDVKLIFKTLKVLIKPRGAS